MKWKSANGAEYDIGSMPTINVWRAAKAIYNHIMAAQDLHNKAIGFRVFREDLGYMAVTDPEQAMRLLFFLLVELHNRKADVKDEVNQMLEGLKLYQEQLEAKEEDGKKSKKVRKGRNAARERAAR